MIFVHGVQLRATFDYHFYSHRAVNAAPRILCTLSVVSYLLRVSVPNVVEEEASDALPGGSPDHGEATIPSDGGCVRIFSDLHLGHSGCLISEVRQFAPLLEGATTAIFNGDTIEERCPNFRAKGLEMLSELNDLCDELGVRPVYLSGNHDPETWRLTWADLCNSQVFVMHGHALIKYISPWGRGAGGASRRIDSLWGEFEKRKGEPSSLGDRLELARDSCGVTVPFESALNRSLVSNALTVAGELWPPRRPLAVLRTWWGFQNDAKAFAEEFRPEARFIIMGHTHFPGIWQRGELRVINTGAFFIMLNARMAEIEGGELSVHAIKRGREGNFVRGREKKRFTVAVSG